VQFKKDEIKMGFDENKYNVGFIYFFIRVVTYNINMSLGVITFI